jgi:hypothetical protein
VLIARGPVRRIDRRIRLPGKARRRSLDLIDSAMADREVRPGVRLRDIEPAGEQILCREPANQIVCLMGRIYQYRDVATSRTAATDETWAAQC